MTLRIFILFLLLASPFGFVLGQKSADNKRLDSLLSVISSISSTATEDQFERADEVLYELSREDSATFILQLARFHDLGITSELLAQYHEANWHERQGNEPTAAYLYEELLDDLDKTPLPKLKLRALKKMAHLILNMGDVDEAIDYGLQAKELATELNDSASLASIHLNLGECYRSLKQLDKAIEYYDKGLEWVMSIGDTGQYPRFMNNKGIALTLQLKFDDAEKLLKEALQIARNEGHRRGEAILLTNLGFNEKNRGNYSKAITYYEESLEIKKEINDKASLAYTLNDIGELNSFIGNTDEALKYSRKALNLSLEAGSIWYTKDIYATLMDIFHRRAEFDSAFIYLEKHMHIKDSILNSKSLEEIERIEQLAELQKSAFQDKLIKAEIIASQREEEWQNFQRNAIIASIVVLLLFGAFAFHRFRITKRQSQIIEEQRKRLEEKA